MTIPIGMSLLDMLEDIIKQQQDLFGASIESEELCNRAMFLLGAACAIRLVTDGNEAEDVNEDIKRLLTEHAKRVAQYSMLRSGGAH